MFDTGAASVGAGAAGLSAGRRLAALGGFTGSKPGGGSAAHGAWETGRTGAVAAATGRLAPPPRSRGLFGPGRAPEGAYATLRAGAADSAASAAPREAAASATPLLP